MHLLVFQAIAEPHVRLVTRPIRKITPEGVVTTANTTTTSTTATNSSKEEDEEDEEEEEVHPLDVLVFATGFHSTKFCSTLEVIGAEGRVLSEVGCPTLTLAVYRSHTRTHALRYSVSLTFSPRHTSVHYS